MSLWTPGGEHPVDPKKPAEPAPSPDPGPATQGDPRGEIPSMEDLSPEDRARAEEMSAEMEEVRRQIAATPASDVVANHAMGIYELGAIHLTSQPPKLDEARLAIDALGALVDSLSGRLGQGEPTLIEARRQLQVAFVEVKNAH